MLSLAIDTSSSSGSLAVLDDDRLLGMFGLSGDETYSSRLFRQLRLLLGELQLGLERFDLYSVASGPGSFTGLRIGLAAAKGWAETFSKPVIGISVLEAVAAQATTPTPLLAAVVDARRGQVYGALYERRGGQIAPCGEEVVLAPGELLAWLANRVGANRIKERPVTLASPTPEVFQEALEHSPFRDGAVECVSPFLAAPIGRLAYRRAMNGESGDAVALDANYVRRSDAEMKWKD